MENIKSSLSEIKAQLDAIEVRHLVEKIRGHMESGSSAPSQRLDNALKTRVTRWNALLTKCLGADACLITSSLNGESRYKATLRWRVLRYTMISVSIATTWLSWMSLSLYSRVNIQRVVSVYSLPVEACHMNDVLLMRELLSTGNAYPNDITTENQTLLYVCANLVPLWECSHSFSCRFATAPLISHGSY
jgi:hypothetical protein